MNRPTLAQLWESVEAISSQVDWRCSPIVSVSLSKMPIFFKSQCLFVQPSFVAVHIPCRICSHHCCWVTYHHRRKKNHIETITFFPTSKPGGFLNGDLKIQVIRNGNTQILSAVFAHLFQLDPSEFSPRRRRGISPAYLPPSRWSVATRPPAPFRCPPPGYHLLQMCGAATSHC